jgi:hypothetical protein
MEPSSLEGLSNELFEYVVQELDLRSICNLRLVNRQVAHKATQRTFCSLFERIRIRLSKDSLEAAARVTTSPLTTHVSEITIVGFAYDYTPLEHTCNYHKKRILDPDRHMEWEPEQRIEVPCTPEEVEQAKHDVEILRRHEAEDALFYQDGHIALLLQEALRNIAKRSRKVLESLSLEVGVLNAAHSQELTPREAWHQRMGHSELSSDICRAATGTFKAAVAALSTSGLSVESADIFHSRLRCLNSSLPYDALGEFEGDSQCLAPFMDMKSLSICISNKLDGNLDDIGDIEGPQAERKRAETLDQTNSSGLLVLLAPCHRLEQLCVSFVTQHECDFFEEHDKMRLQQSRRLLQARLPSLRTFYLGGIEVQAGDLTAFLSDHSDSLRSIEMILVNIWDGLLSTVLSLIASDKFQLDNIHLTNINDKVTPLAYFDIEQQGEFTTVGGVFYQNIIHRWGPDTKRVITYSPPHRHRELLRHALWRGQLSAQFGRRIVNYKPMTPEEWAHRFDPPVQRPVPPRRYPPGWTGPRLP